MSFIIPSAASRGGHGRLIKPDVAALSGVEPDFIEDYSSYSTISDLANDTRNVYTYQNNIEQCEWVYDLPDGVTGKGLRMNFGFGVGGVPAFYIGRGTTPNWPDENLREIWWEVWLRTPSTYKTDFC